MLLFRPISSLYARLRKTSTYSFKQKNENERLHNGNLSSSLEVSEENEENGGEKKGQE